MEVAESNQCTTGKSNQCTTGKPNHASLGVHGWASASGTKGVTALYPPFRLTLGAIPGYGCSPSSHAGNLLLHPLKGKAGRIIHYRKIKYKRKLVVSGRQSLVVSSEWLVVGLEFEV